MAIGDRRSLQITGGLVRGFQLKAPKGFKTHPMSEKIRIALFNTLGEIDNYSVLDAFGGSGALAIEALSRGASRADICEIDRSAIYCIEQNLEKVGFDKKARLRQISVFTWINNTAAKYDLIFADPPFKDYTITPIWKLTQALNPNGLLVISSPVTSNETIPNDLTLVKSKAYGEAMLSFYRLK